MAYIKRDSFGEELMVSASVGANAANCWTDIQLVQYMLLYIYILSSGGGTSLNVSDFPSLLNPHLDFKKLLWLLILIDLM